MGKGEHCLLSYVTGYVSKASDALTFKMKEAQSGGNVMEDKRWRQVFRMMCKKTPLEPEMALEFASKSLMVTSYCGEGIYAPIPGSPAKNHSRHLYLAFQQEQDTEEARAGPPMAYVDWVRKYTATPIPPANEGEPFTYKVRVRNTAGPHRNKLRNALGIMFPFERLDIFLGAWCAMFVPHRHESEFLLTDEEAQRVPEFTKFLVAALRHPYFDGNVDRFMNEIERDLLLRGITRDNRITWRARIRACSLLLQATERGEIDPASWSARRALEHPQRQWSPEQAEVLRVVAEEVGVADANAPMNSRALQVSGGPGTGKTEVIIQCAIDTAAEGAAKVLIGVPIGALIETYRLRLPPSPNIVIETVHSAFRITRRADELYIPPGRLRQFDLIIFDEVSQLDAEVWDKIATALLELSPGPLVLFVGDFNQLQPVSGDNTLREALRRQVEAHGLRKIELQQHPFARCRDRAMLDFLYWIRQHHASCRTISQFFGDAVMSACPTSAARTARDLERDRDKKFTFLTVTNKEAARLNAARIEAEFPEAAARPLEEKVPGDHKAGAGYLALAPGMRVRLTQNMEKDRGFVNGALGVVEVMLHRSVFVVSSTTGVKILVHPVCIRGKRFLPVAYGYATTIRRSQGMTLDMAGLRFDRRLPDRGYAYVGASRVRAREDLWHVGKVRRTDWRPVDGDIRGPEFEQAVPSAYSEVSDNTSDDDDRTTSRGSTCSSSASRRASSSRRSSSESSVDRRAFLSDGSTED